MDPPTSHADGRHHEGSQHRHGHTHGFGPIEPATMSTARGIWALKWSLAGLMVTALLQVFVVWVSGSVSLLADAIHNFGDATTAIPLWIAFRLARIGPTRRFPYGYGRVEDFAGVAIVATILLSATVAGYEAIQRLLHPRPIAHLWGVAAASITGFVGNEVIALLRIKVGREIGSAALVADGYHARVDAWTSLAVLLGVGGASLGYPRADPIVGLAITLAILGIVWSAACSVFPRILDAVEPEVLNQLRHAASHVPGVLDVGEVRARWLGHQVRAELNVAVEAGLTVAAAHEIAKEVRHQALHYVPYLANAVVHVDPVDQAGEDHHRIAAHSHNGLPVHSH